MNNYMAPFALIKEALRVNGKARVNTTYEEMLGIIRMLLRAVAVDEEWYRRAYPDVSEAIEAGRFRSAKHHFVASGYFEGRRPFEHEVDPEWYSKAYPDVAEGIDLGEIASAQEHFRHHGYQEGRLPHAL